MNNLHITPSLLVFVEVAKRASFTDAARKLGLSKSGVSQHVKRLEQEIGAVLLKRHTRQMVLTPAGKRLLERSELLSNQISKAIEEATASIEEPQGPFSITCTNSLEECVAMPALVQLCREFPLLEPRAVVDDRALDLIDNNLDAAIFVGRKKDSSYRTKKIGQIREIFCASPAYIQQFGRPQTFTDLHAMRWISLSWQRSLKAASFENTPNNTQDIKPQVQTNTLSSAVNLAMQGMGFVFLPDITAAKAFEQNQLVPLLPHLHRDPWAVNLVHPYGIDKPRHLERFFELVQHYFKKARAAL